jgi:signal transduction histidine kinase
VTARARSVGKDGTMSSVRRGLLGWDAAVVGTCAAAAATIVVTGRGTDDAPWGSVVSLALIVVVYLALGRRALRAPKGSSVCLWATALLIASGMVASWFNPFSTIVQAVLFPLMWVLSSRTRSAVIRSAVLATGMALSSGLGSSDWTSAGISALLAFAFTLAIGSWITRIEKYGTERDRLLTELRAAHEEVTSLERQAGMTQERARVAREIHDTIAQSLTGLVMTAQRATSIAARDPKAVVPTLAVIEELAQEALAEARTLVASYTPVTVSGGLPATLAALAERFSTETGVAVVTSGEAPGADRESEVVLLRCAQEALANVRKHAHARTVQISLETTAEGTGLTVTDDGVGIGDQAGTGYGLAGMAERVRIAGGRLAVGPSSTGGTTVRVVLPRRVEIEADS